MEEYRELLDDLHHGEIGNRLLNNPDWIAVQNIAKGIAEVANRSLRIVDPEDKVGIIRLQQKIEFYEGFVSNLAETLYRDGMEAFEIAQELGLTNHLFNTETQDESG